MSVDSGGSRPVFGNAPGGGDPYAAYDEMLVVAGQSLAVAANASGTPAGWTNTARVKFWKAGAFATYNPAGETNWGPEIGYALAWLTANAANSKVLYIVKHAVASSQLGSSAIYGELNAGVPDWAPASAGENYAVLAGYVSAARAALGAALVTIRDILWIQGETDARISALGTGILAAYASNAGALYAQMRSDFAAANANVIAHIVSPFYSQIDSAGLMAQQRTLAALSSRNYIIDPRSLGYNADTLHLNAPGTLTLGASAYGLTHGGIAPAALSISSSSVDAAASAGTTVGTLSCTSYDGKADTLWSLDTASSNFEIVGTALKVRSGASLVAGTEALIIRATAASGLSTTFSATVTITSWVVAGMIAGVNLALGQAYRNGTLYTTLADAISAGALTLISGIYRMPIAGLLASAYTVAGKGATSATAPDTTNRMMFALDDGNDGASADELVALAHYTVASVPTLHGFVFTGGALLADLGVTTSGNSIPVRGAMRVAANNTAFSGNGSAAQVDTSVNMPVVTQLVIGNREQADRPWLGTVEQVIIINNAVSDANLPGLLA